MAKNLDGAYQERAEKKFIAEGEQKYVFSMLGDTIAQDLGYEDIRGMDAIYRYLIDKYHWLPHQVKRLTVEDLYLLLDGYASPKEDDTGPEK